MPHSCRDDFRRLKKGGFSLRFVLVMDGICGKHTSSVSLFNENSKFIVKYVV
jgi:hypothetical protein